MKDIMLRELNKQIAETKALTPANTWEKRQVAKRLAHLRAEIADVKARY
jgi:hypothetical protein